MNKRFAKIITMYSLGKANDVQEHTFKLYVEDYWYKNKKRITYSVPNYNTEKSRFGLECAWYKHILGDMKHDGYWVHKPAIQRLSDLLNTKPTTKPYWLHDCDSCIYLGTVTAPTGHKADIYTCPSGWNSDILRFGMDGDYSSLSGHRHWWMNSIASFQREKDCEYDYRTLEEYENWLAT